MSRPKHRPPRPRRHHARLPTPHPLITTHGVNAPTIKRYAVACFQSALLTITAGRKPTQEEWRELADCPNTLEALVDLGKLTREVMPIVEAALAALAACAERFIAGQSLRLDGPGLDAMRRCIELYEECAAHLDVWEMAQAERRVMREVEKARAAGFKGMKVIAI